MLFHNKKRPTFW